MFGIDFYFSTFSPRQSEGPRIAAKLAMAEFQTLKINDLHQNYNLLKQY